MSNSDIQITSAGAGYTSNANLQLTITGGGGVDAVAKGEVVGGKITRVWIEDAGSGYTGKPTVTIQDLGGLPSTNATITIVGETDKNISVLSNQLTGVVQELAQFMQRMRKQ